MLYNSIISSQKQVAELTDRVRKETDTDFHLLAQKKLSKAQKELADLQAQFGGEIAVDVHEKLCDLSTRFGGPAFDLWGVGVEDEV